jgi:Arc/MetJ family transcription regulator
MMAMMCLISNNICSKENIMRTTINIRDDLMEALLTHTKAKTKTKAIELSIREYIEKKSLEGLLSLSGKINIDSDWQKEEEAELNEYRNHS